MSVFIPGSFLKNDVLTLKNNLNKEDSDLPSTLDVVRTAFCKPLIHYFYRETKRSQELLALNFKVPLLSILDDPANQKNKY